MCPEPAPAPSCSSRLPLAPGQARVQVPSLPRTQGEGLCRRSRVSCGQAAVCQAAPAEFLPFPLSLSFLHFLTARTPRSLWRVLCRVRRAPGGGFCMGRALPQPPNNSSALHGPSDGIYRKVASPATGERVASSSPSSGADGWEAGGGWGAEGAGTRGRALLGWGVAGGRGLGWLTAWGGDSPGVPLATGPALSSSSPVSRGAAPQDPQAASLHFLAWWHLQDVT